MKQFKDFGINTTSKAFVGTKVEIHNIINTTITVYEFRIVDSKYTKDSKERERINPKCLHLQISIGEMKHVLFTGSGSLMDAIQQVPENGFPFTTRIIKENKRFLFT